MIITDVPRIDASGLSHLVHAGLSMLRSLSGSRTPDNERLQPFGEEFWPQVEKIHEEALARMSRSRGCIILENLHLEGVEEEVKQLVLLMLASQFDRPQPTDQVLGNPVWQVRPRLDLRHTPSFTERAGAAEAHLDSAYKPFPEGKVFLYCDRPAPDGGGRTGLLDGEEARVALQGLRHGEKFHRVLASHWFPFLVPTSFRREVREDLPEFVLAPVFSEHLPMRWRYDSIRAGFELLGVRSGVAFDAALALHDLIENAREQAQDHGPLLRHGECLITNNYRILHSRSHFDSKSRLLYRVRTSRRHPWSDVLLPDVRVARAPDLAWAEEHAGMPIK